MNMLAAKLEQREYRETYPELKVELVSLGEAVMLRISGRLTDAQHNQLQVQEDIDEVEKSKNFRALLKDFYMQYPPRDVDLDSVKTFSFEIQTNDTISWKQFAEFLAWYKIAYYTSPVKKLVTIEKDLPA